ncbi:hypothetical protein [Paenimyroides aestuarii]|uniref:LVIVD repeat-containing protein n=1 Tax=Paenimyroides aestuarii TaxID=2968490 RepID=A0ABY5NR74_9FLAO|nr:hypothetical protein [Paenimyroides aestuarii]UUV21066.1 hypothetical protein NPX36_12170 [Paenimyroides aestuarii]
MKNLKKYRFIFSFLAMLLLQSCWYTSGVDDFPEPRYSQYTPITLSRAQLEGSIGMSEPRAMIKAGKIYVKDSFIFITDENKGFHIYDNSNPNAPQLTGFLYAPGATDMAIKNNTIYINQAVDLVAISFNNNEVTVHKRIQNAFPQKLSPDGWQHQVGENEIIVDWK